MLYMELLLKSIFIRSLGHIFEMIKVCQFALKHTRAKKVGKT